jgi:hypothetical protein
VDAWGSVHRIADGQSSLLDAMGEELAVFTVDLGQRDTKEGWKETCPNFQLKWSKEWGCVQDHSLDILPLVLQTEGEAIVCHLGVAHCYSAEHFHSTNPLANQLSQPLLLPMGPTNKATQVPLPSQVVDLKANALKSLMGNGFVLRLAAVVQFARLKKVAI